MTQLRVRPQEPLVGLQVLESDVARSRAEMRTWVSSRSTASMCQRLLVDGVPHREDEVDGLKEVSVFTSE